jgi:hypothetical protein
VDAVPAAAAELTGVPPDIVEPASRGIEGLIILIKVLTEGFGFVYSAEFGFSKRRESGSTCSVGIYAIARVVIYPRVEMVLYGWRYCMTTWLSSMPRG